MKYLIIFIVGLLSCATQTQKQGLMGKVLWEEGNQMPGPGKKSSAKGVVREIYIYEAVARNQATMKDGFYSDIKANLVEKVSSGADGSFKVTLPPGTYSVFTREDQGLFANLFDGNGVINPVKVSKGKFEEIEIKINYNAAY